jgi:integrase
MMRQGRVFKRGSSWSYVVDVNAPGAPRKQRTKSGFPTKAIALQALHDVQESIVVGRYVARSKLTLGQYLTELWLPAMRASVRPSTWTSYEAYIRLYVVPRIGDLPLQSVDRTHLRIFYGELEAHGRVRGSGGLSRKTVHNVHVTLLKALGDALEDQLIPRNPAIRAHRGGQDRPVITTWTAQQVQTFLTHVAADRLFALWRLAVATGMRRAELLGLRWSDIDFDGAQLAVRQTRLKADGSTYFGAPKTARSRRTIAIDPVTRESLRRHKVAQARERFAVGGDYGDEDLVFCFHDGRPLDPDGVTQRFQRHARDAKLPKLRFHGLRHTHATLGLMAEVHPKVMQERLGHSSVAFTLDIYSHALPSMQAKAAHTVAALIDGESR